MARMPISETKDGRSLEWSDTDGKAQAEFLDNMVGKIIAAFVICASGYERLMSRPGSSNAVYADERWFDSFDDARRNL